MKKPQDYFNTDHFSQRDREFIILIMTTYANNQINEFVDWCNETRRTAYIPNSFIGKFNLDRDENNEID